MRQDVVIVAARRYGFSDNGKRVEGVTVTYFDPELGPQASEDRRGVELLSVSAGLELWSQLEAVPGLYEAKFTQKPGKGGRPSLALAGLTFGEAVSLSAEG